MSQRQSLDKTSSISCPYFFTFNAESLGVWDLQNESTPMPVSSLPAASGGNQEACGSLHWEQLCFLLLLPFQEKLWEQKQETLKTRQLKPDGLGCKTMKFKDGRIQKALRWVQEATTPRGDFVFCGPNHCQGVTELWEYICPPIWSSKGFSFSCYDKSLENPLFEITIVDHPLYTGRTLP